MTTWSFTRIGLSSGYENNRKTILDVAGLSSQSVCVLSICTLLGSFTRVASSIVSIKQLYPCNIILKWVIPVFMNGKFSSLLFMPRNQTSELLTPDAGALPVKPQVWLCFFLKIIPPLLTLIK